MGSKQFREASQLVKDAASFMNRANRLAAVREWHALQNILLQKGPIKNESYRVNRNPLAQQYADKANELIASLRKSINEDFQIHPKHTLDSVFSLISLRNRMGKLICELEAERKIYQDISRSQLQYYQKLSVLNFISLKRKAKKSIKGYLFWQKFLAMCGIHPHEKTWHQIQPNVQSVYADNQLVKYGNNQLSLLFQPDQLAFLDNIYNNQKLQIHDGELGHVILARCYRILESYGIHPTKVLKVPSLNNKPEPVLVYHVYKHAKNRKIYPKQALFKSDKVELLSEIKKLYIHMQLYPNDKRIWLGNWSKIQLISHKFPGRGIYLNSRDDRYSWALNRGYMRIAGNLGYEFVFPQQQMDNVRLALETENAAFLLEQAVKELHRTAGRCSMYNAGERPTYTMQEMLALLDMDFKVTYNNQDKMIHMRAKLARRVAKADSPFFLGPSFVDLISTFEQAEKGGKTLSSEEIDDIWVNLYFPHKPSSRLTVEQLHSQFEDLYKKITHVKNRLAELTSPAYKLINSNQRKYFLYSLAQLTVIEQIMTQAAELSVREAPLESAGSKLRQMIEDYINRCLSVTEKALNAQEGLVKNAIRVKSDNCSRQCIEYISEIENRVSNRPVNLPLFKEYQRRVANNEPFKPKEKEILRVLRDVVENGQNRISYKMKDDSRGSRLNRLA